MSHLICDTCRINLEQLFEAFPGLYLVLNPDLNVVAVSEAYLAATTTSRSEIIGKGIFDVLLCNPNDADAISLRNLRNSLEQVIETQRANSMPVQKYDIRNLEMNGGGFEERYWSSITIPVMDEADQLRYIIHQIEDVTELVRLKSKDRALNKSMEELCAKTVKMELGLFLRDQEIQANIQQLLKFNAELEARVEALTADLQVANSALQTEITKRGKAQKMLQQTEHKLFNSQKNEIIGRMTAGIAHDFNNLLMIILSCCETASRRTPNGEIESIRETAQRATRLIHQLLAFSRQQVLLPQEIDLGGLVAGMGEMLPRILGEDIAFKIVSAEDLWTIEADPGQIEQIIMNLAVNARDAMTDGGTLSIKIHNIHLDQAFSNQRLDIAPGDYVMLCVSDTGVGMDRKTQERIFEPFFTTKPLQKGTGLGLAIVFGIVKQSGGSILLYSEPGIGTTFEIYFPAITILPETPCPS